MGIDMKRARAVLERVNKFLGILIREQLVKEAPFLDEGELEDESCLADDVWEVLNSAPRQFDVGTVLEQCERYKAEVEVYHTFYHTLTLTNALAWAQTPYEAKEGGAE